MQRNLKRRVLTGTFVLMALLSACGGPVVKNPTPLGVPGTHATYPTDEYRISVGDQLDVKFFYNPELNDQVTVRPDGRISLQLIPEVVATGFTPSELSGKLSEQYASELVNPAVTVMVRSSSAYKIFIDGEVNQPGAIDLTGPLTVFQSIVYAGGFKFTARTDEVVIIRRGPEPQPMVIPVNIKSVIEGTSVNQDITLRPYDIVYVPRSTIANVNLWMQQYIRDAIMVLPREFLLYYAILD